MFGYRNLKVWIGGGIGPVVGEEGVEVLNRVAGDARQDVAKVREWVLAERVAAPDQAKQNRARSAA